MTNTASSFEIVTLLLVRPHYRPRRWRGQEVQQIIEVLNNWMDEPGVAVAAVAARHK